MNTEINRPCPWCRSMDALSDIQLDDDDGDCNVFCFNCGIRGPDAETRQEAILKWNDDHGQAKRRDKACVLLDDLQATCRAYQSEVATAEKNVTNRLVGMIADIRGKIFELLR